jgi:hypothetical protein
MQEIQTNYLRFLKIHLHNYGVFWGSHDFVFDRQRTIIQGGNATGKTTIVKALAHLGPAPGVKPNLKAKSPEMSVEVVTRGDRHLVQKFGSLIFLGGQSSRIFLHNQEGTLADVLDGQHQETIKDEARDIFRSLVGKRPWKIELPKDPSPNTMSMGEQVCLNFAFVFAVRKVLNLDLPAVFDSPYGYLDLFLRQRFCAFLRGQSCQQILLAIEEEFKEEDEPHYKLNYER